MVKFFKLIIGSPNNCIKPTFIQAHYVYNNIGVEARLKHVRKSWKKIIL